MKTTMIRFFSVLAVALCMTACGNYSGSSDREATTPGTSITTTAPVVTTTVATVTNEPEEAVTTTTSSSSEETTVTTAITTPKVTTTTKKPTTTTKAPVVTTTKKPTTVTTTKTTTTKKPTTTTTKKKLTTTTTSSVSGKTMYVLEDSIGFKVGKNHDWWDRDTSITLSKGDKVTAYETVTADTPNGGEYTFTKVKLLNGKITYVLEYVLATKMPTVIKITQSDVDRLVKELQIYADEIFENKSGYSPYDTEWVVQIGNGYWGTYEEHLAAKKPSNSSWNSPEYWNEYQNPQYISYALYDDKLTQLKEVIDAEYIWSPNCHIVVYTEYVTKTNGYTGWDIYFLR